MMDGDYGMASLALASIAMRQIAKRRTRVATTGMTESIAMPTVESRQVRRARERAESKAGVVIERTITAIQQRSVSEMYDAPRQHEGSPPPHHSAHSQRYPKHSDPEKGQVHGGECNITRCDNRGAVFWNMGTYGLYCPQCARGINRQPHKSPLCVLVEAKPALADMEQFKVDHDYYGSI